MERRTLAAWNILPGGGLRTAPLLAPLGALVLGVELARALGCGSGQAGGRSLPALALAAGSLTLALASLALARRARPAPSPASAALALAAVLLLAALHAERSLPAGDSLLLEAARRRIPILGVEGRVVRAPLTPDPGRLAARDGRPPPATLTLEVEALLGGEGRVPARGRILVRIPGPAPRTPGPGARVRLFGRLRPFPGRRNPGGSDLRRRWLRRGVCGTLTVPCPEIVEVLRAGPGRNPAACAARLAHALRERIWRALATHLPPGDAGLLGALLLGIRAGLPARDRAAFRRTGTLHFFAISGLHVALAAGGLLYLLRRATRSRIVSFTAISGFLLLYAGVTGAPASVIRASVMFLALLLGHSLARRASFPNSLALAALVLLVARPWWLHDAGFLLSFAAVAAIGLLARGRSPHASPHGRGGEVPGRSVLRGWIAGRLASYVRGSLRVTAAAWAATLPITLTVFHAITPGVLPANLVLLPLVALVLAVGIPSAALIAVAPGTAALLAPGLRLAATLPRGTAAALDGVALGGPLHLPSPPPAAIPLYYAGLALLAARRRRPAAVALGGAALLYASVLPARAPRVPEIRVLDVGQGACALVRLPDGSCAVVDAGSSSIGGVGERVIAPALLAVGVRRIDVLVLSHADADHVNATDALLERFPVARIVHPPGFEDHPLGRGIARRAGRLAIPCLTVARGAVLLDDPARGCRVDVVHPPRRPVRAGIWDENDGSLVIRVRAGPRRWLLPGDVEEGGIDALLRLRPPLRLTGIVLPHHGAYAANLGDLLARTRPSWAVASARRGFTPPAVRAIAGRLWIPLLGTWEGGAVLVRGGRAIPFRGTGSRPRAPPGPVR